MAHDTRAASVAWSIDMNGKGVCSLHCLAEDGVGLVGHTDGGVSLLDLRERRVLSAYNLHGGDVRSVAMWSESSSTGGSARQWKGTGGVFALTTSFDGKGCVWKLSGLAARGKVAANPGDIRKVVSLVGHTDKILCGVFSPLTNDIFTSGADGNVMCWSPHKQ
jgi:WD40 repeat protein